MFSGLSITEWVMVATFCLGIIGFIHKTLGNQKSQEESLIRLNSSIDGLRNEGDKRSGEYRREMEKIKKEIDDRIKPLETEMKINANFIAAQGATLNSINSRLQNLSTQMSTLLTRTWEKDHK